MTHLSRLTTLLFTCTLMSSACSSVSFEKHAEKHKNLSLENLISEENLSPEKRQLFESSLVKRAEIKSQNGDYASAVRHAKMALKVSPDDPKIKTLLGEALLEAGDYQEAEETFFGLMETHPSAIAYQGYGLALLAQSKTTPAQNWLNKAVMDDSQLWRSWNGLGVIYDKSADWRLAEQSYKAGINVSGQNTTINNNLGISYLKQMRLAEAIIAFENVQALPGGKSLSDMNYRTALALNGEMEKAQQGASDTQVAQLYNKLGVLALGDGDPKKAISYLKKAISTNPSYFENAVKNLELAKSALQ